MSGNLTVEGLIVNQLQYSPVADPSVLVTVTLNSVDDGLLRTSTGCAGPLPSITLYVV